MPTWLWTKNSWMSPIIFNANSVEKMHVFCPWSSFRMSACTVPRTLASTQVRILAISSSVGSRPLSTRNLSTCWSIAVLKNIDRMIGAGPLIVSETEVVGAQSSKPSKRTFMSSRVAIDTPELPTLP
ncbi:MAG: hypothetical protein FAZ92_02660 [Accumulibacter sp.]|nr:MAG: hypothetical protein FAZ92_02660 [Accumulibacter sp.]